MASDANSRSEIACIIVGEESDLVAALTEVLPGEGIAVVAHAATGAEALELIHGDAHVVLVIETALPDMTIHQLVQRARAITPDVAFVTYTAETTPARVAEALAVGVRGIVLMESPVDRLVAAIKRAAANDIYLDPNLNLD